MKNIYLIGFMGVGKSTAAWAFAKYTGARIIDTDHEIEKRMNKPVSQIFAEDGEEAFRAEETRILEEVAKEEDCVVSCGGGLAMRPENVRLMKRSGTVVLLEATVPVILERVSRNNRRPLLEGKKTEEQIREMMDERMPAYKAAADVRIRTDVGRIKDVPKRILRVCR